MKRFSLILSIGCLLLSSETIFAQTASDYYLPLRVGNYLQFQSSDRTTTYSIIGADSISGHQYFLEKRSEVMTGTSDTKVYALFWIRKDSAGEILMGAMGVTGSTDGSWSSNLDSATIFDPPGTFFSSQSLVPGYTYSYSMEGNTWVDSTMSNVETVQVTAGTFTNCVKIREIKRQTSNDSLMFIEYTYYAPGMGIVKVARDGWSSSDLVGSNTTLTSVEAKDGPTVPACYSLFQNYPNPFNPSTSISFSLPKQSVVTLQVFDVLGREMTTIVSEELPAGTHTRQWNPANAPSGVYFYRLQAGAYTETKKLVLVR